MGWKTKAKIQNAVSILPQAFAYNIYYWIQRHYGSLRNVNPVIGLKAGIKTSEMIEASGRSVRDSSILEIGTGWRINTPIALWLLGADRYGERFWQQLREQVANARLQHSEIPTSGNVAAPLQVPSQATPDTHRPRGWLAPRSGWLR